jgi:hypothetical protein
VCSTTCDQSKAYCDRCHNIKTFVFFESRRYGNTSESVQSNGRNTWDACNVALRVEFDSI